MAWPLPRQLKFVDDRAREINSPILSPQVLQNSMQPTFSITCLNKKGSDENLGLKCQYYGCSVKMTNNTHPLSIHSERFGFVEARLWGPFKELEQTVQAAIHRKLPDAIHDLEIALKKHKPDFIALLKNPVSGF